MSDFAELTAHWGPLRSQFRTTHGWVVSVENGGDDGYCDGEAGAKLGEWPSQPSSQVSADHVDADSGGRH
jgi:hypothetical protein